MDFGYLTLGLLLLLMQGCIGQEDDNGGSTLNFVLEINPSYDVLPVNLGVSRVFTCSAKVNGEGKVTLRWEKDGEAITSTNSADDMYLTEKAGMLMLRIRSISDKDGGSYKCIGSMGGQEDSHSIRISIVKSPVIHSPTEQHGILGKDGKVLCNVTASPAPTISWMRVQDGKSTPIGTDDKYLLQGNNLIIKSLELADEGVYLCDIMVLSAGFSKDHRINYQVVKPPKIKMPLSFEPNNLKVGVEAKIHCEAEGRPKPVYSYLKDGKPIPESEYDATSGILTIPELKRSSEANYTCVATNIGGSHRMADTLNVKIPPTIQEMSDIGDAVEDGVQTIECVSEGDPAPSVTWMKQGMESVYTEGQDHPKFSSESSSKDEDEIKVVKSTLTFDPVKAQDAGVYVCVASNQVGEVEKQVKMDILYKPHFDVEFKQDVFYGWENHPANLTCQASANQLASIKWKRRNPGNPEKIEDIQFGDDNPTFKASEHRQDPERHLVSNSLKVNIQEDDQSLFGEYFCEASNPQGTAQKTLVLKEAQTAGQPIVSITTTLSTMVTIGIEKPAMDGGQKVTSYTYTYHKEGNTIDADTDTTEVAGDHTTVNLKDLTPSTSYVVRVRAVNAVGQGAEIPISFKTLQVSKPSKMKIKSNREGSEANSYRISWDKPEDGGSPITKFVIRYKQVEIKKAADGEQWQVLKDVDEEFKEMEIKTGSATSYDIKSLNRDSFYEVRVSAVNKKGSSDEELLIIKTSKGDVPDVEEVDGKGETNSVQGGEDDTTAGANKSTKESGAASSAGLSSGLVIAIIIILLVIILVAAAVAFFVVKKKRAAGSADPEGGAEDGKEAAEVEKLIQKENSKVENETEKPEEGIEETKEFEPDEKPEVKEEPPSEPPSSEPTIQITPETPEKPDDPAA